VCPRFGSFHHDQGVQAMKPSRFSLLFLLAAVAGACSSTPSTQGPQAVVSSADGMMPPAMGLSLMKLRTDWQAAATKYLDARSADWLASPPRISNVPCAMSCHTTFPYVLARASLRAATKTPAADAARSKFEARVVLAVNGTATPFYGQGTNDKIVQSHATEAVLNAAALALDDIGSGVPLSTTTRSALDRMWAMQRADGAWDWLDFTLEPWERGSDWGAALAALVAGTIPPNTTTAQALGTAKLIGYFRQRLADKTNTMALHDRAMLLWASGALSGLLDSTQADAIADDLAKVQQADGGFALSSWGRGNRVIDTETKKSDGYATALAILALCRGAPEGPKRKDVRRGLAWLAQNQREDGSWVGRSVNVADAQNQVFMTDAATAYASIAIATCGPKATP
jgi:hypothetical protein